MIDLKWICGTSRPRLPAAQAREDFMLDAVVGIRSINPFPLYSVEREEYARAYYDEQRHLCDAQRALQLGAQ